METHQIEPCSTRSEKFRGGGRTCFGDILIFAKFLIGLHGTNPSFQDLNGSPIMYWKYDNFKSVRVHSWTPLKILYWYFCIQVENYFSLCFSGKRCAISHWMAVPKNRRKCESATTLLHRGDSLSLTCIVWKNLSPCMAPSLFLSMVRLWQQV